MAVLTGRVVDVPNYCKMRLLGPAPFAVGLWLAVPEGTRLPAQIYLVEWDEPVDAGEVVAQADDDLRAAFASIEWDIARLDQGGELVRFLKALGIDNDRTDGGDGNGRL